MSKQKWEKLFDENFGDFGDPITFIETSRRLGIKPEVATAGIWSRIS